jgi:GT2 family glycosyltransferase
MTQSNGEAGLLPFVSVVIPCFKRKEWLQEQIALIRAQDYPADRFEIIMVDNGSRDGTFEWLQEEATKGPVRLTCIENTTQFRSPEGGSRNLGLTLARGEIVGFTDSDCLVEPNWISNAVRHFSTGIGIVCGRTVAPEDKDTGLLSRIKVVDEETYFDTCNIFYRKEAIDKVGGFARDVPNYGFHPAGEDTDLGLRVKQAGYRSYFADDVVVAHRVRHQTPRQWLLEPCIVASVPYLAHKHPIIRERMLFLRYFLTPATALFDLALLSFPLSFLVSPWFLLLWLPFSIYKAAPRPNEHLTPIQRPLRIVGGTVRAAVIFGVLIVASIRNRSLVI